MYNITYKSNNKTNGAVIIGIRTVGAYYDYIRFTQRYVVNFLK